MFTKKGPQSEENALLKLWKAINRYTKTLQTDKRDALAVAIHKTFIFEHAKLNLPLPNEMLTIFDPGVPYDRPSTPALKSLQDLAEKGMKFLVEEFLQVEGFRGSVTAIPEKTRTKVARLVSPESKSLLYVIHFRFIIMANFRKTPFTFKTHLSCVRDQSRTN